jgi:hypothetical protein
MIVAVHARMQLVGSSTASPISAFSVVLQKGVAQRPQASRALGGAYIGSHTGRDRVNLCQPHIKSTVSSRTKRHEECAQR